MYTVHLARKDATGSLEAADLDYKIEKLFSESDARLLPFKLDKHSPLNDIQKGVFGTTGKMYELPRGGIIVYGRFNLNSGFAGVIHLAGFPQESKDLEKLKISLEKLANETQYSSPVSL